MNILKNEVKTPNAEWLLIDGNSNIVSECAGTCDSGTATLNHITVHIGVIACFLPLHPCTHRRSDPVPLLPLSSLTSFTCLVSICFGFRVKGCITYHIHHIIFSFFSSSPPSMLLSTLISGNRFSLPVSLLFISVAKYRDREQNVGLLASKCVHERYCQ